MRHQVVLAALILLTVPCPLLAEEQDVPMPYFASLKSDEVNMRIGPSKDHPIRWVYRRSGLPVEVMDRHNEWLEIRDPDGEKGWVAHGLVSRRRNVMVQGTITSARQKPQEAAAAIFKIEPGAVGTLIECRRDWCRVEFDDHKGWLDKRALWGVGADEEIQE